MGHGRFRRPPRAIAALGALACALALSGCEVPRQQPPLLIVDKGDGTARIEVPICAGDVLLDITISEDAQNPDSGGNLDFNGEGPARVSDGLVAFDLGPTLISAPSAAGLPRREIHAPFLKTPVTFRDFGLVWVTTPSTEASTRIADVPSGPGNAWVSTWVDGSLAFEPTTATDGEAIINSWCADQRASASGK